MVDPVYAQGQVEKTQCAEGGCPEERPDWMPAEHSRGSLGDVPEEAPRTNGDRTWAVLDELGTKIHARCRQAESVGDVPAVARLRAMRAVVDPKLSPFACPDAVTIAGDAARAAYEGLHEPDWYAAVYARQGSQPNGHNQLNLAVRLLKSANLWPWDPVGWDNLTSP